MKKITAILLSCIIVVLSLVSCGFKIDYKNEDNSLIGTWNVDGETMTNILLSSLLGSNVNKLYSSNVTFNENNTMNLHISIDISSMIYLTDDKMFLLGENLNIIDFNGSVLVIECGGMPGLKFVRKEKSFFKHGVYYLPKEFNFGLSDIEVATIRFKSKDETYLEIDYGGVYEYDEDSGNIIINYDSDEGDDFLTDVVIDGMTMTCNVSDHNITLTKEISFNFEEPETEQS